MAEFKIVTGYVPGLVGRVTQLHAIYYAREWRFGAYFETRVAREMAQFIDRYDGQYDQIWSVLVDGNIEASITIDAADACANGAHLRWFIASDGVRGTGCGKQLIEAAVDFCRQRKYSLVYLNTFAGLNPARHLYETAGFRLAQVRPGTQWGTQVEEQRFELELHR